MSFLQAFFIVPTPFVKHKQQFKPIYVFQRNMSVMTTFDIVCCVGPRDTEKIKQQMPYTQRNIIGYRNIYLVSNTILTLDGCIWIDESMFPFSMETVQRIHGTKKRNGWYLQQLLKLYAGTVIPGIASTYLVLDADTFFLKPTTFISEENKCLYNYGTEYHLPYFYHIAQLCPTIHKCFSDKSGICHHMMFQQQHLQSLFALVSTQHNHKPFYELFLEKVSPDQVDHSGASEYEIYFNYVFTVCPQEVQLRPLVWKNSYCIKDSSLQYDYISCHWYMSIPV